MKDSAAPPRDLNHLIIMDARASCSLRLKRVLDVTNDLICDILLKRAGQQDPTLEEIKFLLFFLGIWYSIVTRGGISLIINDANNNNSNNSTETSSSLFSISRESPSYDSFLLILLLFFFMYNKFCSTIQRDVSVSLWPSNRNLFVLPRIYLFFCLEKNCYCWWAAKVGIT